MLTYFLILQQVAPTTVHPTIDKAAHYFGLKVVHTPVGSDFKADVQAMKEVRFSLLNLNQKKVKAEIIHVVQEYT
jgi:hypothetical protein